MRTLIFCFDGTWNGRSDAHATNVLRFHRALDTADQVPFYFAGPGDEDNNGWFGRFFGGVFGIGWREILDKAMTALAAVFRPGDRIAVVGFSRGAAIARKFAAILAARAQRVDFLGCWDTVGAFLPIGRLQQRPLFGDLNVSALVTTACHAVALDEDRAAFEPNLMNQRPGVTEVWFRGNHADVGGGYADRRLSDITLQWMAGQAAACGIVTGPMALNPDFTAPIHREDKPRRRRARKRGVKRAGEWTDIPPVFHPSVPA